MCIETSVHGSINHSTQTSFRRLPWRPLTFACCTCLSPRHAHSLRFVQPSSVVLSVSEVAAVHACYQLCVALRPSSLVAHRRFLPAPFPSENRLLSLLRLSCAYCFPRCVPSLSIFGAFAALSLLGARGSCIRRSSCWAVRGILRFDCRFPEGK